MKKKRYFNGNRFWGIMFFGLFIALISSPCITNRLLAFVLLFTSAVYLSWRRK